MDTLIYYIINLAFYGGIGYEIIYYLWKDRVPPQFDFNIIFVLGILLVRLDIEQTIWKRK